LNYSVVEKNNIIVLDWSKAIIPPISALYFQKISSKFMHPIYGMVVLVVCNIWIHTLPAVKFLQEVVVEKNNIVVLGWNKVVIPPSPPGPEKNFLAVRSPYKFRCYRPPAALLMTKYNKW